MDAAGTTVMSAAGGARTTRFLPTVQVILIPTRHDFKAANLTGMLWWGASDFQSFQQSAISELRLCANIHAMGLQEAKDYMYQPTAKERKRWSSPTRNGNVSDDDDDGDDDDYFYYSSDDDNDGVGAAGHGVDAVGLFPTSPHHCRGQELKDATGDDDEDGYDDAYGSERSECAALLQSGLPKVSSISCIKARLGVDGDDDVSNDDSAAAAVLFPKVSSLDGLARAVSEEFSGDALDEDALALQLCVPLPTPAPLVTGPRFSWGGLSNRRKRGSWRSSATIAFYSTVFVVAFVLVDRYCCGAYLSSIY